MATWLITGCWAGLGRALATAVLDRGETVVVTARDAAGAGELARAYPGTAHAMPLDVTGHAQIRDAAGAAHERFGAIDVLVNNAGHGYRAAAEEAADDQAWELFAISFFGPAALIQAVLPGMRERQFRTDRKVGNLSWARGSGPGPGAVIGPGQGRYGVTRPGSG